MFNAGIIDLIDEPARRAHLLQDVAVAAGFRDIQFVFCPGEGDIGKTAFFFHALDAVIHRPLIREDAVVHIGYEDRIELQTLGRMHGHQLYEVRAHRLIPVAIEAD